MTRKILLYLFLLFFSCCLSSQLSAQYILELDSVQAFPDDQVSLGIYTQDTGPMPAFRFDMLVSCCSGFDMESIVLQPPSEKTLIRKYNL